jgi:hypothetical protein
VESEDGQVDATGRIGPLYPQIAVFYVFDARGILFLRFLLGTINRTLEGYSSLLLLLFFLLL